MRRALGSHRCRVDERLSVAACTGELPGPRRTGPYRMSPRGRSSRSDALFSDPRGQAEQLGPRPSAALGNRTSAHRGAEVETTSRVAVSTAQFDASEKRGAHTALPPRAPSRAVRLRRGRRLISSDPQEEPDRHGQRPLSPPPSGTPLPSGGVDRGTDGVEQGSGWHGRRPGVERLCFKRLDEPYRGGVRAQRKLTAPRTLLLAAMTGRAVQYIGRSTTYLHPLPSRRWQVRLARREHRRHAQRSALENGQVHPVRQAAGNARRRVDGLPDRLIGPHPEHGRPDLPRDPRRRSPIRLATSAGGHRFTRATRSTHDPNVSPARGAVTSANRRGSTHPPPVSVGSPCPACMTSCRVLGV